MSVVQFLDLDATPISTGVYRLGFEDDSRIILTEHSTSNSTAADDSNSSSNSSHLRNSMVLSLEEEHVLKLKGNWSSDITERINS